MSQALQGPGGRERLSSSELMADWASDLEAVLYAPEVEEAIHEVCVCVCSWGRAAEFPREVKILFQMCLLPFVCRSVPVLTLWIARTSTPLTTSTNYSQLSRFGHLITW